MLKLVQSNRGKLLFIAILMRIAKGYTNEDSKRLQTTSVISRELKCSLLDTETRDRMVYPVSAEVVGTHQTAPRRAAVTKDQRKKGLQKGER